jgi:hypothetical protein
MNAPLPPDPLEAALAHPPYLDDAGFTIRVIGALPDRGRRIRAMVLGTGGLLSGGVGAVLLAKLAPELGPALLAMLSGAAPRGEGLAALLALAVLVGTALIALLPEPSLAGERNATEP